MISIMANENIITVVEPGYTRVMVFGMDWGGGGGREHVPFIMQTCSKHGKL